MMEFNLEKMKNLIDVSASFEDWVREGKKESIIITEVIPMSLWNLFRIFLLRFSDTNTVLVLPPVKEIPAGFLYGNYKRVEVSEKTEFICEGAFINANIMDLKVPDETIIQNGAVKKECIFEPVYAEREQSSIDKEELKLFLGKLKALASFEGIGKSSSISDVIKECNNKKILKGKIKLQKTDELFKHHVYTLEKELSDYLKKNNSGINSFSMGDRVITISMGFIIRNNLRRNQKRFECLSFLFENEGSYAFVCVPLGLCTGFNQNQLGQLPFILEKLVEKMSA